MAEKRKEGAGRETKRPSRGQRQRTGEKDKCDEMKHYQIKRKCDRRDTVFITVLSATLSGIISVIVAVVTAVILKQ